MLANGVGKSRAHRDGSIRVSAQWRLLFLSTGELKLAYKMREYVRRAKAGQEVRLVDVPANAGAGYGIFENLHGFESADTFARHLKNASEKYYGTPIREFLHRLTNNPDGIAEAITAARSQFITKNVSNKASGQVQSVAGRFAVIAAAGTLATAMGILPWPPEEADEGVTKCFQAWLEERGSDGNREIDNAIA